MKQISTNSFNRRNFLKISGLTAAGAVVAPAAFGAKPQPEGIALIKPPRKIIYRTLGKTGIKVPVVSMGVMRADNPNLVKAALDAGMTHLDTAHGYQNGKNEEMLGKVLKNYKRDSYTIATKIHLPKNRETGMFKTDEATPEAFNKMLKISLERLQLDYVDILYNHALSTREATLYEPVLQALKKAKADGKTRFIGVSTHRNEPEVIRAAIESGVYDVVLTAYNFRQDHREEVKKAIDQAAEAGLGIVLMKTMAGGFFDKEKQKPINTKAALKWALQSENAHTSIPGFTTFEELQDDIDVMQKLRMKRREKKDLEYNDETGGLYCPGCGNCLKQCKERLPVPDIMRAYMYTYGYKDLNLAQNTLDSLELPAEMCTSCDECVIENCTKKFNIREKIQDVNRVRNIPKEFITG